MTLTELKKYYENRFSRYGAKNASYVSTCLDNCVTVPLAWDLALFVTDGDVRRALTTFKWYIDYLADITN